MPAFTEPLEERFRELGLFSNAERARHLKTDEATYSRIVNGRMTLTRKRAATWAALLFPDFVTAATDLERRLLGEDRPGTVSKFFDGVVAQGGAVSAETMPDLLDVLETVTKPIICIEYRDVPRAGPASKYEGLGSRLGQAIAHGVTLAMFQPFGSGNPLAFLAQGGRSGQSLAVATYLFQVQQKCATAYLTFREDALKECKEGRRYDEDGEEAKLSDEDLVDRRLRLYERRSEEPYLGSGFQAKLFYVQYTTSAEGSASVRHQRILQWVSTPRRDLLVYRGETDLSPDAIRDSFYPVGHFFDATGYLPPRCDSTVLDEIGVSPVVGAPQKFDVWKEYHEPPVRA